MKQSTNVQFILLCNPNTPYRSMTPSAKLLRALVAKQQSPLNPNAKAGTKQASPSSFQRSKKTTNCDIDCRTKAISTTTKLPNSNSNSNKSTSAIVTSSTWPKHAGIAGYVPTSITCDSTRARHGKISICLPAAKLHTTKPTSTWPL